jgi:hypothetical protein
VNNVLCRKVATGGYHCLTRGETPLPRHDLFTFLQYGRPTGAMDGPIHATSTHQAGIGRIDDSIGCLPGNITPYDG